MVVVFNFIEILFFSYFTFVIIYLLVFSISAFFTKKNRPSIESKTRRFAIFFPCYKEDNVIIESIEHAINQSYSKANFDIFVIADSFLEETQNKLSKMPINYISIQLKNPTKTNALKEALETIRTKYDVALVLDADNIIPPNMLNDINLSFNQGYKVVQTHRIAKNLNTNFAILDAISEEINNFIFRKGHRSLGFSSALIGSGMAFDYQIFEKIISNSNAVGGMDKELEMAILQDKIKIEYLNDTVFKDEKVQNSQVFSSQRKRWIFAQQYFLRKHLLSGIKSLFVQGNVDYFDKVLQMTILPRIILIGMLFIISACYTILDLSDINIVSIIPYWSWILLFSITLFVYLLSIPSYLYNLKTFKAIISLPKAFFIMVINWFSAKVAAKKFLHTTHGIEN